MKMKKRGKCPVCGGVDIVLADGGNLMRHPKPGVGWGAGICKHEGKPVKGSVTTDTKPSVLP